jgi:Tfp pilus assembly protein PilF
LSSAATGLKPQPTFHSPERLWGGEKQRLVLCLALFAATLVFYNPIVHSGFILLDDVPYILSNPPVRAGLTWATVKWSFTTLHAGYWHPLTWLSHALDCQIFGLNPAGHHYVSLLFHATNAVLLFLILEEATGFAWPSLIVAALFALHPINVESVAWAAERKNVLSMFFFLAAMLAYNRYARRGGVWRNALVSVLFVLGFMAKPQIITLPCVLLLWDYWPLRRMFAGSRPAAGTLQNPRSDWLCEPRSLAYLLAEKIPLFVIVAATSVITFRAQRSADAVRTLGEFGFRVRLENAIVSYALYLRDLVWPAHLAPMYPHPGNGIPAWEVGLSAIVLLVLTVTVVLLRERRYLTVGWLWFLGVLVPMIGLVQVGDQARADRFLYIPMIGIMMAVVWLVWEIAEEKKLSKIWFAGPAAILLILGSLTYHQLGYWRDGETLWRYTLTVTHDNYMAHDNLAMILDKQGRVEEAIPEFKVAEALHKYPLTQVLSMGVYLQRYGHVSDAIDMYGKVLHRATDPQMQATAYSQIGAANAQIRNFEQAALNYQNALKLNPKDAGALIGSGLLAERNRDWASAAALLARAADVQRSDVTYLLLADALRGEGNSEESGKMDNLARTSSPDLSLARKNADDAERLFECPQPMAGAAAR